MNERQVIELASIGLAVGDNTTIVCPYCAGGRSGEPCMSIGLTEAHYVVYHCFRAGCGRVGGFWPSGSVGRNGLGTARPKREFAPRVYLGETQAVGEGWRAELLELYGLSVREVSEAGWVEDIRTGRLVCPIRGLLNEHRGYELRQRKQGVHFRGPKTDHYREVEGLWAGWYGIRGPGADGPNPNHVVLVEDVVSALKVSRWFPCMSLMGSTVTADHLREAFRVSNSVVLALDRDASSKALAFQRKFRVMWNFRVALLSNDLKYESDDRIKEIVNGV